jgi:hypothetical protein
MWRGKDVEQPSAKNSNTTDQIHVIQNRTCDPNNKKVEEK